MTTPSDLLARQLGADAARPLFTFYDDATGERVELSVATTANWVAKTANFLVDEHGIDVGDVIAIRLPLHWQTAVLLLAGWSAGARIGFDDGPAAVTFVSNDVTATGEVIHLSLAAMGGDFSRLVAASPDAFAAVSPSGDDVVGSAPIDLPHGARVLTMLPYDVAAGLGYGLVAPLAVDGSVVMVRNPKLAGLAERAEVERVTHTLGVDVAGVPRLDG